MINKSIKRTIAAFVLSLMIVNVIITCYNTYLIYKPDVFSQENNIFFSDNYLLGSSSILENQNLSNLNQVDSLNLTVLSDNYPNGGLSTLWGLSILIETDNLTVLIDTGQAYSTLRDNSLFLNKNLSKVDFVVISHEHIDHVGGLSYVAEVNPGVTVFVPSLMDSQIFDSINQSGLNIIKINETTIIQNGFAIIGELNGNPYEQALVVNVKDVGLVIFVGCSHPGVEDLIEKASTELGYNPYMVIGGFHMLYASEQEIQNTIERLIELGVKRIYPIHCSGINFRHYMSEHYPQQYGRGNVGFQLTINKFTITTPINSVPISIYTLIVGIIISITVLTGWVIKKKKVIKRA
ncbi:MAG: MBL fold metallo-hydrolase [Candidatus Thorarchaeota archaeon]